MSADSIDTTALSFRVYHGLADDHFSAATAVAPARANLCLRRRSYRGIMTPGIK